MLSIIIVHYKTKDELSACIKSIIDSKPKIAYEIVVVDNDEKKTTERNLRKNFSEVVYVPNKNLGFSQGNNLGAKIAKGDYLFFLNPDTRIFNNTLEELFKFIKKRKDIGAVSPLLLNQKKSPHYVQGSQFPTPIRVIFSLSFIHKLFPNNFISRKFFLQDWDRRSPKRVDVFPGTAFLVKKDVFEKIGGFDEKYFLFYEEADLAQKIRRLGFENYIVPKSKLVHLGGISTKTRKDIEGIYKNSQYYYFKKWYGMSFAIFVKLFTSLNKYHLAISLILLVGFLLRIYKLSEYMSFIGDQGWFYLSARDMILTGKIPLVGITSSHTWIHQGPYWTYILGFLFYLSNFNPVVPGYFTALIGTITVFLIYKIFKEMFSVKVALIAALLYSTSPLTVLNDRLPYHTSLIPIFTLLFTYSLYKWTCENKKYFVWSIILVGILYNFELATFSLVGVLILFFLYGLIKKQSWFLKTVNLRSVFQALFGLGLVMLPIVLYDIRNDFKQSLGFGVWIVYKLFLIFPAIQINKVEETKNSLFLYLFEKNQILTFSQNGIIALIILIASIFFILYLLITSRNEKNKFSLMLIMFFIPLAGFVATGVKSDAYLPVFFTTLIVMSSIIFNFFIKKMKFIGTAIIFVVIFLNIYFLSISYANTARGITFLKRKEAVEQILKLTEGKAYNLVGRGIGSQFESFTMNYEFLLWKNGRSPSKAKESARIYVREDKGSIVISKK